MRRRWSATSPRVVFPTLIVVLLLAALLRPNETEEDARLSTHSAAPNGARALYDVSARLGWRPVRRETPFSGPLDSGVTYAVLAPVRAISPVEAHRLLDAVRGGAGLLVVASEEDGLTAALTDSLRLDVRGLGYHALIGGSADQPSPSDRPRDPGAGCRTSRGIGTEFVRRVLDHGGRQAEGTDTLLGAIYGARTIPAALARPLGRGRVVVVADPDLLRNDVLRLCGGQRSSQRPGVRAVRFLEAAAPAGGTIVFDEWHQGYGAQPEEVGPVTYALARTGWGRAVAVGLVAALLWLWAAGARVLVPVERAIVERRSPLEHVGALARAYEQVGASRTTVRRMVRGLRRRHPSAARRGADDAAFLTELADQRPALAAAVALVRDGVDRQLGPEELTKVGDAVEALDAALGRPAGAPTRPTSGIA